MTIGGKLRLVNAIMLFTPMLLAVIGTAIIYLSLFNGRSYSQIMDYFEKTTDNLSYAYDACNFMYDGYKKQLETTGDEKIEDIYPQDKFDGSFYIKVFKNEECIFSQTQDYDFPESVNYEDLVRQVNGTKDKQFSIIDNNIVFKGTIAHNSDTFTIIAIGKREAISLVEKNSEFYISAFLVNLSFILLVIIFVHFSSKLLYKAIFDRVEYSLNILIDGVNKISEGNLEYRIEYDRNDEFKPICDDFNKMAQKLSESVEKVQKQEQNRKEIMMSITHDIFSPLTSIKAYVEGIENGIASNEETKKKYLDTIKAKTEQIEKMVSQLLLYSKLEFDELAENPQKINLRHFLNDFIRVYDSEYAVKNVQLSVEADSDIFIRADRDLLTRMLTNILDNSAKYSNKPIVHVLISLTKEDGNCILSIEDDGPGVAQNSLEHIFEVFYRSDAARNQTANGSGIGLSIVSNIVTKNMHGKINAENVPTGGLKIIIEVPTAENDD
ncbi:MAG: sensor histidine kinase [Acutalibacteraceae bacterium]